MENERLFPITCEVGKLAISKQDESTRKKITTNFFLEHIQKVFDSSHFAQQCGVVKSTTQLKIHTLHFAFNEESDDFFFQVFTDFRQNINSSRTTSCGLSHTTVTCDVKNVDVFCVFASVTE